MCVCLSCTVLSRIAREACFQGEQLDRKWQHEIWWLLLYKRHIYRIEKITGITATFLVFWTLCSLSLISIYDFLRVHYKCNIYFHKYCVFFFAQILSWKIASHTWYLVLDTVNKISDEFFHYNSCFIFVLDAYSREKRTDLTPQIIL